MSNSFRIFTITRNKGLRVIPGATFKLVRLSDGRHFIKPRDNSDSGVIVDVSLLHSPFATVSNQTRVKGDEKGGSTSYIQTEVTLSRFGLAMDDEYKTVLVPPVESDAPYVPGLTGACDHVVLWFPESEMRPLNTGAGVNEHTWLMPGLVKILIMTGLWFEWRDPSGSLKPPHSIKIENVGGDVVVTENDAWGGGKTKVASKLRPFVASHTSYRLPANVDSGRGVICY